MSLKKIDDAINCIDEFDLPTVKKLLQKASELICRKHDSLETIAKSAEENYRNGKQRQLEALTAQLLTGPTSRTTSCGRRRTLTARVRENNEQNDENMNNEFAILRGNIDELTQLIDNAQIDWSKH